MSAGADKKDADVWGYTCGNCEEHSPGGSSDGEAAKLATAEGWGMGLDGSGQAHYLCSGCGPAFAGWIKGIR